ncbi:MAG: helix-turn-helix transcriptional regulator [Eubacteriaceae bacterium]
MNKKLEPYINLVNFLADFLGENTEVVLHDLTDWHRSVVAIRNGHISGREVGAPITDLSLNILRSEVYKEVPFLVNYHGVSRKGDTIRSATFFIKDDNEDLVGMLCINSDCQELMMVRNILNKMINIPEASEEPTVMVAENFNIDVKELVDNNISRISVDLGDRLHKLSKDEKVELVEKLQAMGTFMVKGTVWYLAESMGVSVPTVYRYISLVKKKNDYA